LAAVLILAACVAILLNILPFNQQDISGVGESGLTVYFIDVGQADSALVVCCGEQAMLIDGGNAADSNLMYSFLRDKGITHLDYIVATHAHEDHVGGLAGALNYATVGVALSPVTSFDTRAFGNFVKYLDEQGVSITVPQHGDSFRLGCADVHIVGPIQDSSNPNNTSIVMKITHGDVSFLITGDAERELEQDILDAGYDISATVLKVGHHGSETSTTYPFLREIMPQYAVISSGVNNQYGHPHENTLSRLRDADVILYRTDMQGDITAFSDGRAVAFSVERNANIQTNPTEHEKQQPSSAAAVAPSALTENIDGYIGNRNSLVFHRTTCRNLPAEQNRIHFDTRADAIGASHNPCGNCNP
jgi:competence protein ComEC